MFGKKKEEPTPVIVEAPVEEKAEEVKVFVPSKVTSIGEGITMIGTFESSDSIEIQGTLRGKIFSENNVYVGKTGSLQGDGVMNNLIADGSVEGNLECRDVAAITESGTMNGNLLTKMLKTEPGANFNGKLTLVNKE